MGICIVCKEKWTGNNRCHCSGCHRTFNSVGAFDRHRRDGGCLDPIDLGMEMSPESIWASKMSEEDKVRLGYGRKENNGF